MVPNRPAARIVLTGALVALLLAGCGTSNQTPSVACQRDGTIVLPRGWDHLGVLVSMAGVLSGVNGDTPALSVGGAFDDEGVGC